MKSMTWKEIVETVGIAAIVASLLFVGLQMQQDRRIAELATYQERAIASAEISLGLFSNTDYQAASLMALYGEDMPMIDAEGWASPSRADVVMPAASLLNAPLFMFDNSHFQYQEGFLPEEHWVRVRQIIKIMLSTPFENWAVRLYLSGQRPAFREVLIEILDEIEQEQRE